MVQSLVFTIGEYILRRLYNLSLNSIDLSIPDVIQFDSLC